MNSFINLFTAPTKNLLFSKKEAKNNGNPPTTKLRRQTLNTKTKKLANSKLTLRCSLRSAPRHAALSLRSGQITGIMRKITRLVIFPNRLMFSASLRT